MSGKAFLLIVTSVALGLIGLVWATSDISLAPRDHLFEVLSLGVLLIGGLLTYFGVKKNLH